jgi:hypothetical protein
MTASVNPLYSRLCGPVVPPAILSAAAVRRLPKTCQPLCRKVQS